MSPQWVIRWECEGCKQQFVETRPMTTTDLNVYELGRKKACGHCGHIGFACNDVRPIENPQPRPSEPNLFGGIRP